MENIPSHRATLRLVVIGLLSFAGVVTLLAFAVSASRKVSNTATGRTDLGLSTTATKNAAVPQNASRAANIAGTLTDTVAAVTVQAAGRGKPYLNLQDGRRMLVDYRGGENATRALQSGQARVRALASADFDGNATPDLVVGYAYNGGGIVTIQRGNPDAYAPQDDSVFVRMQQGYNPDALLPQADTYQVPEPVDFIQAGDFNHDNRKDVLVGTRGRDLFLLSGDGQGGLSAPEQIALPGTVTTVVTGEFRAADGWTDVAIGVEGPSGPALLIFDGLDALAGEPISFQLNAPATAVQIDGLDNDPFRDIAVAAGDEIDIIHGWGRKQKVDPQTRIERINLGCNKISQNPGQGSLGGGAIVNTGGDLSITGCTFGGPNATDPNGASRAVARFLTTRLISSTIASSAR